MAPQVSQTSAQTIRRRNVPEATLTIERSGPWWEVWIHQGNPQETNCFFMLARSRVRLRAMQRARQKLAALADALFTAAAGSV